MPRKKPGPRKPESTVSTVQIASSARPGIEYKCAVCGRIRQRDQLAAKRVSFMEMGEGAKTIRARVVSWLCKDPCMLKDPDYNRERFAESPGYADTEIGRQRDMELLRKLPDPGGEEI